MNKLQANDILANKMLVDEVNNNNKCRIITPPLIFNETRHERHETLPIRSQHEHFFRESVETILNSAVFNDLQRDSKVLEWHPPDELKKLFDMSVKSESDSDDQLLQAIRDVIRFSVKTGHPYFVNQLFSTVDPYALIGQWLTDALNPSVYTYEVSPVFVLMEEVVLREMRAIVGWKNGAGDGLFSPGGSISNAYAISCARYKYLPDVKVRLFRLVLTISILTFCFRDRQKDFKRCHVWFCLPPRTHIIRWKSWHRSWVSARTM